MTRQLWSVFLAAGCAACGSESGPARPVFVTVDDAESTVELGIDQELIVRLASNPTTGYSWSFTNNPEGVLTSTGESRYRQDSPGLVGSGGLEDFPFKAVHPGRATLRFMYERPWECGTPAAQEVVYSVVVRD